MSVVRVNLSKQHTKRAIYNLNLYLSLSLSSSPFVDHFLTLSLFRSMFCSFLKARFIPNSTSHFEKMNSILRMKMFYCEWINNWLFYHGESVFCMRKARIKLILARTNEETKSSAAHNVCVCVCEWMDVCLCFKQSKQIRPLQWSAVITLNRTILPSFWLNSHRVTTAMIQLIAVSVPKA